MQKWLPDEFTSDAATVAAPVVEPKWDRLATASTGLGDKAERFHKESRFADPSSLMANLTQDERSLIFELVEQDVAREYEDREIELKAAQEKELTAAREQYEQGLQNWATDFGSQIATKMDVGLREISQSSARLAIQLAEKVARAQIALDPEILVRALHTTLFKIPGGQPISVRVNPQDAAWLQERPDLIEQMNIGAIESDRRIESGGCVIRSGNREWDATLAGQLETLGEIVEEAISTAGLATTDAISEESDNSIHSQHTEPQEDTDDPGLE